MGGPGPRGEVGLGAERVTEHPSRCPSPRCCPAGAAGAPRGTPGGVCVCGGVSPLNEPLVVRSPFRTGGLILPAVTTQPRSLVVKRGGGGRPEAAPPRAGDAVGAGRAAEAPRG